MSFGIFVIVNPAINNIKIYYNLFIYFILNFYAKGNFYFKLRVFKYGQVIVPLK